MNRSLRSMSILAGIAGLLIIAAGTGGERVLRVGVLDVNRLQRESAALRTRMEAMAAPARAILAELQVKQGALSKALEDFSRKRTALSDEAVKTQAEALQKQAREVEELSRKLKESMDKAQTGGLEPLRQQVGEAVAAMARERGLSLVLTSESVLYNTEDLDLTGAVAARLDGQPKPGQKAN